MVRIEIHKRRIFEGEIREIARNQILDRWDQPNFCSKYDKRDLWRVFKGDLIQMEF